MTSSERRRGPRRLLAASLVVLAAAAGARRADANDEATARALFQEGRRLVASGDYAAACPKFEESLRAEPGIGTTFNLADCWEHLGRTASAWSRFLDVAEAAKTAGQREREQVARARASALEPRLSRLVIENSSPDQAITVERDGLSVGPASWGVPVPVDPGAHVVLAAAPRKKTWSVTVAVSAPSEIVRVAIPALEDADAEVPPVIVPAAAPPVPALETPAPHAAAVRSPLPAIVAGAVGLAGLTTAAIFGLQFHSANSDAEAICPSSINCTEEQVFDHTNKVNAARRDRTIAYVSAGAGAVALGAAAVLWWRSTRIEALPLVVDRGLAAGVRAAW